MLKDFYIIIKNLINRSARAKIREREIYAVSVARLLAIVWKIKQKQNIVKGGDVIEVRWNAHFIVKNRLVYDQ